MSKFDQIEQTALKQLVEQLLTQAKAGGASAAEVHVSRDIGFSVSARLGEVETLDYVEDKGIGITAYMGLRKGSASTTDTRPESVRKTVQAACAIAKQTDEDPASGLAPAELMANTVIDLDLCHPWQLEVPAAIDLALECEAQGRTLDKRISNSEGASVSSYEYYTVYGNSHGFIGDYHSTRHSMNCVLIAEDDNGMRREWEYTSARAPENLDSAAQVGRGAAEKTVARLGARRLKTMKAPVIFQADVARSLLGELMAAISGGNLYRKTSFLLDCLGKPVFSNFMNIWEEPLLRGGVGSAAYDNDGVATSKKDFVKDGVLASYVLSAYSARKLKCQTTGNSGGVFNLRTSHGELDRAGLLKKMGTGLLVTDTMGHGANIVTGDYSQGAAGFWVENGEIQYPVEEITIAANLRDLFLNCVAIANDIETRGNVQVGSMLFEEMAIAGE